MVTLREADSSCDLRQAQAGEKQGSLGRPASLGRVIVERPQLSELGMGRQEVLDWESETSSRPGHQIPVGPYISRSGPPFPTASLGSTLGASGHAVPMQETRVQSLGRGRSPEEGTHSSILAWRIPWTEDTGRLQSMGLQRVRHD